jgi:hypothetical protein
MSFALPWVAFFVVFWSCKGLVGWMDGWVVFLEYSKGAWSVLVALWALAIGTFCLLAILFPR